MSLKPIDWSVVIVGRWNRAILTPAGIGKRLFGLPEGTPLEVMLPIDAIAPPRVSHQGVVVVASSDRLVIQPKSSSFPDLDQSRQLALKALGDLPETPVSGIGVNLKYKTAESLNAINEIIDSNWDAQLSDNQYDISNWGTSRSLIWKDGSINISVTMNSDGEQFIHFNFDQQTSDQTKQKEWLTIPISDIEDEVTKILKQTMELNEEDISNGE